MKNANIVFLSLVLYSSSALLAMAETQNKVKLSSQQKRAIEIISSSLLDSSPYIRAKAVEVVSNAKYKPLAPAVRKLLTDDFVPVRFNALIAIGEFKDVESTDILKNLIEKGDETTKIGAAFSLAKMGNKKYVHFIQQALSSGDQTLCANAAMLLGKLEDKSNLELLYAILKDEKSNDALMFSAAEAIASLKDDGIYERLWTLLISKHADDRLIGISAMGALGTRPAIDALLTMLYDEILEVRLAAATELGKLGNQSGWPEVYDALTKPISEIQKESLLINNKVNDKNDVSKHDTTSTAVILDEPEAVQRVKTLSALAIGYINNDKLAEFLPSLLLEKDVVVRLAAAQSAILIED